MGYGIIFITFCANDGPWKTSKPICPQCTVLLHYIPTNLVNIQNNKIIYLKWIQNENKNIYLFIVYITKYVTKDTVTRYNFSYNLSRNADLGLYSQKKYSQMQRSACSQETVVCHVCRRVCAWVFSARIKICSENIWNYAPTCKESESN